jgi:hypothetical protein
MCHFVTAVLPTIAPAKELDVIAQAHGKQLRALDNPSIEAQIKPTESYFIATAGVCDCGTPLGALVRGDSRPPHDRPAQEKRLRLKGWSEAKIARSLKQKEQHDLLATDAKAKANLAAAKVWLNLVTELTGSRKTPYICLLLHWYDGSVEGNIKVRGREVIKTSELTAETLGRMKEDVLYEFRAV